MAPNWLLCLIFVSLFYIVPDGYVMLVLVFVKNPPISWILPALAISVVGTLFLLFLTIWDMLDSFRNCYNSYEPIAVSLPS
jgi:membrane protein YdbS with pleckstrin-like domain